MLKKITLVVLLACISTGGAIALSLWAAETFFFDKFFYYKSVTHGYWIPGKKLTLEDFKDRSQDIIALRTSANTNSQVLGAQDDGTFTVALIGDSYVWGEGVRVRDRLGSQLEKKLQEYQPSKVYSFAIPGDSILDYVSNYQYSRSYLDVDAFVIALVPNDVVFKKPSYTQYSPAALQILEECDQNQIIFDFDWSQITEREQGLMTYVPLLEKAWTNPANICSLQKALNLLKSDKTIFFITDDYTNDPQWDLYHGYLSEQNVHMVSSTKARTWSKYAAYWENPWESFVVSAKETHPNSLAHQMYAEVIVQELLTNPQYNFGHGNQK